MEKYFRLLFILILFVSIKVNNAEIENSNSTVLGEFRNPCDSYCFNIVKLLLDHDNAVLVKENQFAEMQAKIHEQELIIKGMQTLNETIKSKDIQLAQQLELITSYKTQIDMKDVNINAKDVEILNLKTLIEKNEKLKMSEEQLAELQGKMRYQEAIIVNLNETIRQKETQQIDLAAAFKSNIASNEVLIANLQSQVKSQESQIMEKDKQTNSLHNSMCITSSCLGKLTDVYTIKVPDMEPFSVPCDSKLAGSGWTVVQRRKDGSEDFNRTWEEYKAGFGDFRGEFFLGLEKLYLLTKSQPHELYIYLEDFQNEARYAQYSNFVIGNETDAYELKMVGDYSGSANDALTPHLNMKFSTPDRDNDETNDNCAKHFLSGWWYQSCGYCDLNGVYTSKDVGRSGRRISWNKWHTQPLKFTQMMIRPKSS